MAPDGMYAFCNRKSDSLDTRVHRPAAGALYLLQIVIRRCIATFAEAKTVSRPVSACFLPPLHLGPLTDRCLGLDTSTTRPSGSSLQQYLSCWSCTCSSQDGGARIRSKRLSALAVRPKRGLWLRISWWASFRFTRAMRADSRCSWGIHIHTPRKTGGRHYTWLKRRDCERLSSWII